MPIYNNNFSEITIPMSLQMCKDSIPRSFQWTNASRQYSVSASTIAPDDAAFLQIAFKSISLWDNRCLDLSNPNAQRSDL